MGSPAQRRRYRRSLNSVDRVILVGDPLRSHVAELLQRDDHLRVVHNGFRPPPPEWRTRAVAERRPGDIMELISVSNLNEGKGVDVTLGALAHLRRRGCDGWRYRVVGDGDQRAALERQARRLGIGDAVQFLGARPHSEVYPILADSEVFVLPSYREAFGIAYLEAMAMGLVAIGVRGQGPEAFLQHGQTGFLLLPRDETALASLLVRLHADPRWSREIAEHGKQEAWAHWTWNTHATALVSVYDEVLAERRQ